MICTQTYRDRVENRVPADEGRGVFWEGSVINRYIYDQKSNTRFIPVLLGEESAENIPIPLKGDASYGVKAFELSDPGFEGLYRELTAQPGVVKPGLGARVILGAKAPTAPEAPAPLPKLEAVTAFPSPEPPLADKMTDAVFSGSVIINRPILEVFNYVTDVASITEWIPFLKQIEIVNARKGSAVSFRATLAVGELLKPPLNRDLSFIVDLNFVPGRRLSYRSAYVGIHTTMEFEPTLNGSLVKSTLSSSWGWQAGVFSEPSHLSLLNMNDWINRSLLSLKRNAEARAVDVNPIIFFNYRRSKAAYVGGRIYDALCQEFGVGCVFRDFESLMAGSQWQEGIKRALSDCRVVVAHIGDGWEKEINSRIGRPDWVRDELEMALQEGSSVTLIPVFTSDHQNKFNMVDRQKALQETLPDKLKIKKALANRQGIFLRTDPDFRQDLENLLRYLWSMIQADKGARQAVG